MVGESILKFSFKRSKQVVLINTRKSIKIDDEHVQIDPQLLFQRLATAANNMGEDLATVLSYELTSVPSSLFDGNGLMRESHKSTLTDYIWNLGDCRAHCTMENINTNVIDGGNLLHRVPWLKEDTFEQICSRCVDYVQKRYQNVVVFDGYTCQPRTKDMAYLKRSKGLNATEVLFDSQTPFKSNKDVFLTNARNKQRFINLLGQNLENSGCDVLHAKGDADLRIVQTAIALSSTKSVFVVGSDTDSLVLLTQFCNTSLYDIYFGDNSKAELKCKIWDIKKTRKRHRE